MHQLHPCVQVWVSAWTNRRVGLCISMLSISLKVILTGAKIPSEVPALGGEHLPAMCSET